MSVFQFKKKKFKKKEAESSSESSDEDDVDDEAFERSMAARARRPLDTALEYSPGSDPRALARS